MQCTKQSAVTEFLPSCWIYDQMNYSPWTADWILKKSAVESWNAADESWNAAFESWNMQQLNHEMQLSNQINAAVYPEMKLLNSCTWSMQFWLTSIPAKVGKSWSKRGSSVEPWVPNRECITSATFLRYCSSVSSCRHNTYIRFLFLIARF